MKAHKEKYDKYFVDLPFPDYPEKFESENVNLDATRRKLIGYGLKNINYVKSGNFNSKFMKYVKSHNMVEIEKMLEINPKLIDMHDQVPPFYFILLLIPHLDGFYPPDTRSNFQEP